MRVMNNISHENTIIEGEMLNGDISITRRRVTCWVFNISSWNRGSAQAAAAATVATATAATVLGQRSIQYKGCVLWNKLPSELQEPMSVNKFKSLLKLHLLNGIDYWS